MREVMHENLKRLEELVQKVNGGPPAHGTHKFYESEDGFTEAWGLFSVPDVSVCRAVVPAGATLGEHAHEAVEIFSVYRGESLVTIGGEVHSVKAGDSLRIPAGVPHTWNAIKDTWMIAVTIPADSGFPDA